MKKIGLIVFLLSAVVYAQEISGKDLKNHNKKVSLSKKKGTVELSLDTIFNAGVPYCLFLQKQDVIGNKEFSVQSLDNKEQLNIKMECVIRDEDSSAKDCFWLFLFTQSGSVGEVDSVLESDLPEIIVKNDLVTDNINLAENEKQFLSSHPQKLSKPAVPLMTVKVVFNETAFPMVERDRSAEVSVSGSTVLQDANEIGYFDESHQPADGKENHVITFYLPGGVKVATAAYESASPNFFKVYTEKDGKVMYVEVNPAKRMEQLSMFLVQLMYL